MEKKNVWYLGVDGRACLYLSKTHSNVFLTLTDLKKNVIKCKTSGSLVFLVINVVKKFL